MLALSVLASLVSLVGVGDAAAEVIQAQVPPRTSYEGAACRQTVLRHEFKSSYGVPYVGMFLKCSLEAKGEQARWSPPFPVEDVGLRRNVRRRMGTDEKQAHTHHPQTAPSQPPSSTCPSRPKADNMTVSASCSSATPRSGAPRLLCRHKKASSGRTRKI